MVEEDAQGDMLGILMSLRLVALRFGCQAYPEPCGLLKDDVEACRVADLGDPVQVGDEAFRIVLFRPREEILDGAARLILRSLCLENAKVETGEGIAVALEQAAQQAEIDGSDELGIDEFLQVLGHFNRPGFSCRCSTCVLIFEDCPSRLAVHGFETDRPQQE
ncbi:MAG: hypothetical protein ACK4TL_16600 [Hyphomicrobiaceae bacterium]